MTSSQLTLTQRRSLEYNMYLRLGYTERYAMSKALLILPYAN